MLMSYEGIKEALHGYVFGSAIGDDGERIVLQWEKLDDGEEVYTATWESKRNERFIWYVTRVYHEDGTVEELFTAEEL